MSFVTLRRKVIESLIEYLEKQLPELPPDIRKGIEQAIEVVKKKYLVEEKVYT